MFVKQSFAPPFLIILILGVCLFLGLNGVVSLVNGIKSNQSELTATETTSVDSIGNECLVSRDEKDTCKLIRTGY